MPREMSSSKVGKTIELRRDQWRGLTARITDHPGLFEEVSKYTWTLTSGAHPYLRNSQLNIYLHRFVLNYLYGTDCVDAMLAKNAIIEHLDNDGLNCTYENLHIASEDLNIAKARTIDKAMKEDERQGFPIRSYVVDVYYSHEQRLYQMQVFFNRDVYFNQNSGVPVEMFVFQYPQFSDLFMDWFYVMDRRESGTFDATKFHTNRVIISERPNIVLKPEEKDYCFVERDGTYYMVLRPDGRDKFTAVIKTAKRNLDQQVK